MKEKSLSTKKIHDNIIWLTRTALMTAILIVSQAATAPLGSTIITGSAVNAILAVSVLSCGLPSGLCVALISPVFAKLFGIGPLWTLIPFIAVGNAAFVSIWFLVARSANFYLRGLFAALFSSALVKFFILFIGVTKIAIPFLLQLPDKQARMISSMFSFPQLLTAVIGGFVAIPIFSAVNSALNKQRGS